VSDLIVLTFLTRNIRGGKGEKDLSYAMFLSIWRHFPATAKKLLPLFANHYGYWKDLLLLTEKANKLKTKENHPVKDAVLGEAMGLMRAQLQSDLDLVAAYEARKKVDCDIEMKCKNGDSGPKISLLAKWLPRENSYFDKHLKFLKLFLEPDTIEGTVGVDSWKSRSQKTYRKQVAKLTSYLSLPEVFLSAQRADEINFHKMASKATLKLSMALLNETENGAVRRPNDEKRQRCADLFVKHMLKNGLKGKALMPDEIVAEILKGNVSPLRAKVLDALWKDLWKNVVDQVKAKAEEDGLEFDPSKMVPLSDVSSSMYGKPMEVAIAMGIGISEITHPAFRHMILTFESEPRWHKLNPGNDIVQKVESLAGAPWGGSTNFEAAYDKILEVCEEHRLGKEYVPSLIVFSDMQFNEANESTCYRYIGGKYVQPKPTVPMNEVLRSKFAKTARKLGWGDSDPTPIVYWNVRNTTGHPVENDTEGAVLLSGFSPSMLKMVMNGEALEDKEVEVVEADGTIRTEKVRVTPLEVLRKALDESLYDPVRATLLESNEGILTEYKPIDSLHLSRDDRTTDTDDEFEIV
jgi:hypothetical protein